MKNLVVDENLLCLIGKKIKKYGDRMWRYEVAFGCDKHAFIVFYFYLN